MNKEQKEKLESLGFKEIKEYRNITGKIVLFVSKKNGVEYRKTVFGSITPTQAVDSWIKEAERKEEKAGKKESTEEKVEAPEAQEDANEIPEESVETEEKKEEEKSPAEATETTEATKAEEKPKEKKKTSFKKAK